MQWFGLARLGRDSEIQNSDFRVWVGLKRLGSGQEDLKKQTGSTDSAAACVQAAAGGLQLSAEARNHRQVAL